ncbi:MAG: hypothetical protein WKF73_07365 [Nocardioidaceae bacterium]
MSGSEASVGLDVQLGLEWACGGEPFDRLRELVVAILIGDAGARRLDEHVQGAAGRHEKPRGLATLAG